jgi:hypothetical protein
VGNSTSALWWFNVYKFFSCTKSLKYGIKLPSDYVCRKQKCLDLGPIYKITHCIQANIQNLNTWSQAFWTRITQSVVEKMQDEGKQKKVLPEKDRGAASAHSSPAHRRQTWDYSSSPAHIQCPCGQCLARPWQMQEKHPKSEPNHPPLNLLWFLSFWHRDLALKWAQGDCLHALVSSLSSWPKDKNIVFVSMITSPVLNPYTSLQWSV